MPTDAQLAANRANAQLSTGPRTLAGAAKSSLNAVKTALTGRTVLLPSDEAAEYERHIQGYEQQLQPVGQLERDLVQSIADTNWRLKRIPGLEMAILSKGHLECADTFADFDPSLRAPLIELRIEVKYEKQLRNLRLQEARLFRRLEKEKAELRRLQQERQAADKARETKALDTVAQLYLHAKHHDQPFTAPAAAANGFEFSIAQLEEYIAAMPPRWREHVLAKPVVRHAAAA